jgi:predicted RNA-binding Zn ribbon-like protein
MNFDRYTSSGAQLAVSLVNAFDLHFERGRPALDPGPSERLKRLDTGLPKDAVLLHPPADTDDHSLRRLARALRGVFIAGAEGRADDAARSVNALLTRHRAAPVLSDHDAQPWHLHFTARGASPEDAWGAQASTALAVLIAAGELSRLGICAAGRCDVVFLDTSKNGSRRFCSEPCATRTKVATWRARHAVEPSAR